MAIATLQDTNMCGWCDGTRHYRTDDGHDFAIEATTPDVNPVPVGLQPMIDELVQLIGDGDRPTISIVRPTVVFECNEEGIALSMSALHTFDPGTTHEAALAELGYTVE